MTSIRHFVMAGAAAAMLAGAVPAAAETLSVSGYSPAGSDAAIGIRRIAVERFGGMDGAEYSLLLSDRLRDVSLRGESWFTILVASLATDADAVLTGYVEPDFSETKYEDEREICWAEDADGKCVEHRDVKTECLRVTVQLQPRLQLVGLDGEILWTPSYSRQETISYCPEFDDTPSAGPAIDRMLGQLVSDMRFGMAPSFFRRGIRIMESRRGLEGAARSEFRDAVRLTKDDEAAACAEFARLLADNPTHDSLIFNVGLCAEREGALQEAQDYYRAALASDRSDDEAQEGLRRVAATIRAGEQFDAHFGI